MKRAIIQWILLLAALPMTAMGAAAQQAESAAPPAQTGAKPRDEKNGTGIVPQGVKLEPGMPAPAAPKKYEFPRSATKTLENGLRVFVVTEHSEPAVAARLVILSAGSIEDPKDFPGVAEMTANMLTQGTAKRSAKDIADTIDFIGGTLNAAAGKDSTTVTLDVVKKDLSIGLDLMADVVLHPAFSAEELDRQRQQLLSNMTVQYSDPQYLASVIFARAVYGGSPYGWPGEGTPDTAKKLQRDELAKFHTANYEPNQALLAFAGDITTEEAISAAEKYFGAWPKGNATAAVSVLPGQIAGRHIWLVDKPDAVQTQIRLGRIAIRRADADYIPLQVANRIFGGGYNSRLNTEVRINKGLTYGAFSSVAAHRYTGSISVGTYTRTEKTLEATKLAVDLIAKMYSGDQTKGELDFARDYLAGVYPIQTETAEQVAERVLTAAAFELPAGYNSTYPDRVRGVTLEQVKAMGQRYFTANDLDIVLVGNVSAFREEMKKAFPDAQFVDIPFEQIDLLAPGLKKAKGASASATPESIEEGKKVLLAAANAAGGESIERVKGIVMTETGKRITAGGTEDVQVKWTVEYPDHSHGEVTLGTQHIVQGCDGKTAWLQLPDRIVDVSPVIGEFERGISLFGGGWGVYRRVLAGELGGHTIGEEVIDGMKTVGVALQPVFGELKLYFDPVTHMLVAARYFSQGPQGPMESEQRWSDYRTVGGMQYAYHTVVYRDGSKFVESGIEQVEVNPKVEEAMFVKPEPAPAK